MNFSSIITFFAYLLSISIYQSVSAETFLADEATLLYQQISEHPKISKMRLDNGLEVIILSDPNSAEAGALLSVRVGSWDNPPQALGMAHFVEHLVFMGSKRYPVEGDFSRFIAERGGRRNAFTCDTETNFFFSIEPQSFPEALDRMADFIRDPLFETSAIERERHAVDQEFQRSREQPKRLIWHVQKELSDPQHPYHAFGSGNEETLRNVKKEALQKWFYDHYDAGLMRLVVYSPESIAISQQLIEKTFATLPARGSIKSFSAHSPFQQIEGKLITIKTKQEDRHLSLVWDIPPSIAGDFKRQPTIFLADILSRQHRGSLSEKLQSLGLAEHTSAFSETYGLDRRLFTISIDLTPQGLQELGLVTDIVMEAIQFYTSERLPYFYFEEQQKIRSHRYALPQNHDLFTWLQGQANGIWNETLTSYPLYSFIATDYSPYALMPLHDILKKQAAHFLLNAPESATSFSEKQERWYGTSYDVCLLPQKQNLETIAFTWPEANPYAIEKPLNVTEDLSLFSISPEVHYVSSGSQKVQGEIFLHYPVPINPSIHHTVLEDLYIKALHHSIAPLYALGISAGQEIRIESIGPGTVMLSLKGWGEGSLRLLADVLYKIRYYAPFFFEEAKSRVGASLSAITTENSIDQVLRHLCYLIDSEEISVEEKAQSLKNLHREDFYLLALERTALLKIEGGLEGPFSKDIETTLNRLGSLLSSNNSRQENFFPFAGNVRCLVEENKKTERHHVELTSVTNGHAVALAIPGLEGSPRHDAAHYLLMQWLQPLFFDALRTKQQLAYSLEAYTKWVQERPYALFWIVSNDTDAAVLLQKIQDFLLSTLSELPLREAEFHAMRASLLRLWQRGLEGQEEGSKRKAFIEALEKVSLSELQAYSHALAAAYRFRSTSVSLRGYTGPQA